MMRYRKRMVRRPAAWLWLLPSLLLVLTAAGCGKRAERKPEPAKLEVETRPAGAELFLGGKSLGKAPQKLTGRPGEYRLRIVGAGCRPEWRQVTLKAGATVRETVELQRNGGSVLLESTPSGAAVRRDGRTLGATPLVLRQLPPGGHTVQLVLPGFAERAVSFEVTDARPRQVSVKLASTVGTLIVESEPEGAQLTLDGKPFGRTPFRGELDEGRYQVRVEKDGFVVQEASVSVLASQTVRKRFQLTGAPGVIAVTAAPAGAQVHVDGRLAGSAPLTVTDLAAGEHLVTVRMDGYDPAEKPVEVAAGSRAEVNFVLERSTGGLDLSIVPAGVTVYINDREHGVVKAAESAGGTELIRLRNLTPGEYRITVAHKRATPERMTVSVHVVKGRVARPRPIELWVPNAEVKWKQSGLVETGMLYGSTGRTIVFGAERGVKIPYDRDEFEYVKELDINE